MVHNICQNLAERGKCFLELKPNFMCSFVFRGEAWFLVLISDWSSIIHEFFFQNLISIALFMSAK